MYLYHNDVRTKMCLDISIGYIHILQIIKIMQLDAGCTASCTLSTLSLASPLFLTTSDHCRSWTCNVHPILKCLKLTSIFISAPEPVGRYPT